MSNQNIFEWLVRHHCRVNLEACTPHIENGAVHVRGHPVEECFDENELYKGVLIVANGDTLAARLLEDRVIFDEPEGFASADNEQRFMGYIAGQRNSDGAYIFDGVNRKIARVHELNNNPPTLPDRLQIYTMIPPDFVSYSAEVNVRGNIGTKTRLAIKIPHAYANTHTYQIKRSGYTPLGIGKVTHFGPQGLVQEFFLMHNDSIPYGNDEVQGMLGVHRKYSRDSAEQLVKVSESVRRIKTASACAPA